MISLEMDVRSPCVMLRGAGRSTSRCPDGKSNRVRRPQGSNHGSRQPMEISDSTGLDQPLKRSSVIAVVLLSFVTLGLYVPIWFLRRRRGLNSLDSPRKLSVFGPAI